MSTQPCGSVVHRLTCTMWHVTQLMSNSGHWVEISACLLCRCQPGLHFPCISHPMPSAVHGHRITERKTEQ